MAIKIVPNWSTFIEPGISKPGPKIFLSVLLNSLAVAVSKARLPGTAVNFIPCLVASLSNTLVINEFSKPFA